MRYEPLFNHVFVEKQRGFGLARALPIIGVWLAPQLLHEEHTDLSTKSEALYKFAYYTFLLIFPSVILILTVAILLIRRRSLLGRVRAITHGEGNPFFESRR